jgi:hypothetical protein
MVVKEVIVELFYVDIELLFEQIIPKREKERNQDRSLLEDFSRLFAFF